ncbi:MAG: hypothetical protein ISS23_00590 [Nanoarchaeota archaeon]|nr:hypothetical protein [Nanoarchaeota archaeon]
MTLDIDLVREACLELWKQYHDKIEEKGYSLGKDSFIQAPEGFSIVASISPKYPDEMFKVFRQIIPEEFTYRKGNRIEKYPVIISPSINTMLDF